MSLLIIFLASMPQEAKACCGGNLSALTIAGGADGRARWRESDKARAELYGLFLNARKVFSDDLGDRWIVSLQGDAEHDLKEIRSYQSFLQYKGPLGKWNIRAGHFILPFGLLSDFDTERLLLQSIEDETIGIKLDTGLSVFGFVEDWSWAASLTSGLGRRWVREYDDTHLATLRLSRKFEDLTLGTSLLFGESRVSESFPVQQSKVRQTKVAFDGVYEFSQWITRLELLFGKEEEKLMGGIQGFLDYQLARAWELNFKARSIRRTGTDSELGGGVSFRPWDGWAFRAANLYHLKQIGNENELQLQVLYEFSKGI
ncbi:MAG: hypothetical protein AB7G93_13065 [Bdellovibrionales bacterium]